jgi:spore coat polysaccharide biosynthesis protein SpsF
MRVVAIVQARMGSTRLPGKVLRELAGRPMIDHVVERALSTPGVDDVCVATSVNPLDDPLAERVERVGRAKVHRGSEEDVLSRYAGAAQGANAGVVVRVTADCPLLCPSVSGRVVREITQHAGHCDYASNTLARSYPRGLDTEAFTTEALLQAERSATDAWDREHVTPFIYRHPDRFTLRGVQDVEDRSAHRWTVDTPEDFELVSRIYDELWSPERPVFDYAEILACVSEHPEWTQLNRHVAQRQR